MKLKVHFPGTPAGDYWLIGVDYDNYAAVYSCSDFLGLFKFEYAWLLTRSRTPSEDVVSGFFNEHGVATLSIMTISRKTLSIK